MDFFKSMQFLVPVMEARHNSRDNMGTPKKESPAMDMPSTSRKQPRKNSMSEEVKTSLMKECLNVMKTPASHPPVDSMEQVFGNLVTQKLCLLDPYNKMVAQRRIMEVLFDQEFAQFGTQKDLSGDHSHFSLPQPNLQQLHPQAPSFEMPGSQNYYNF